MIEVNISDYLETDDMAELGKSKTNIERIDSVINDLLLREIKVDQDTIIYLPNGPVKIDTDVFTGERKVNLEGGGMFSSKLILDIKPTYKVNRLTMKLLHLMDLKIDINSKVRNIIMEDVLLDHVDILENSNGVISYKLVNCEFAENADVQISGGSININNSNIPEKIKEISFDKCNITVTNFNADILTEITLIDTLCANIVSSNLKFNTSGSSILMDMKNARLYDSKTMTENFDITTIKTNSIIDVKKGVVLSGIYLNDIIESSSSQGGPMGNRTEFQKDYNWIIEINKLISTDTDDIFEYRCMRGGGLVISRITKFSTIDGVGSNF